MSRGAPEHTVADGRYEAVVTEVGAGLRVLRHGTRDLVRPYDPDEVRPRYSGAVLAPWPNRIADGRYDFGGETHQLPLTEPERGNALHGLVTWDRFEVTERTPSSITLLDRLVPRPGYPFSVDVTVSYTLAGGDGLRTTVAARNTGATAAPWGTAAHPYLQAGTARVDDAVLTVPADQVLDATPDRLLPLGTVPVASLGLDFREARRIADTFVDHAFTGLRAGRDGLARVLLADPSGAGVECEWDPGVLLWVQVHTADTPEAATDRTGLAVEPMTCAPDAFNSGDGLVVLPPGGEHTAWWTVRSVGG
jgi:aldose 1-epimerase